MKKSYEKQFELWYPQPASARFAAHCVRGITLRVVATHREATKPSDREAEWECENGRLDSLRVAYMR